MSPGTQKPGEESGQLMEGSEEPEHTAQNGLTLDKEKILSMLLEQVFLEFDSVSHCQTQ